MTRSSFISAIVGAAILMSSAAVFAQKSENTEEPADQRSTYNIVDSGQDHCYDNQYEIACPASGLAFYGQDAQYTGSGSAFVDNGDGTVTDLITGLIWQKSHGDKMTFNDALAAADTFSLAGYNDWRLPMIKELYSLIDFRGIDPSGLSGVDTSQLTPFIDKTYFDFIYGDEITGERIIDAQYWSNTQYVSTTMNGDATAFGVNFADGRIKGYPAEPVGPPGEEFSMMGFAKYVRGATTYGVNEFVDNGDGTVTDRATRLMWMKTDSDSGMTWEQALTYAEHLDFVGHDDWRLPNAKELQSIVDYSRSPATDGTAAIDPVFECSSITDKGGGTDFPFYWTGTTHVHGGIAPGDFAVYVTFGTAYGFMEQPPGSGTYVLMDVHGAGAQRSDPKIGDPADYPYGHGPQGDVVRIYNYVRAVRDESITTSCGDADNNGLVNISDAVYLINYIFGGGEPPDQLLNSDVDCNEIVNISDAVYLIAYVFGGGGAPCDGCA